MKHFSQRSLLKIALLGFLVLCGLMIFFSFRQAKNPQATVPSPTPTKSPLPPQSFEVRSPDGTMKLIMQTQAQDGKVRYAFIASDGSGQNVHPLFTKIAEPKTFSLPSNSWSPDNKELFILETQGDTQDALVFLASGDPFSDGQQYLDVVSLFLQEKRDDSFAEVTGWDGFGLLHVKTVKDDKAPGPSYWFDLSSKSFLQLAR